MTNHGVITQGKSTDNWLTVIWHLSELYCDATFITICAYVNYLYFIRNSDKRQLFKNIYSSIVILCTANVKTSIHELQVRTAWATSQNTFLYDKAKF